MEKYRTYANRKQTLCQLHYSIIIYMYKRQTKLNTKPNWENFFLVMILVTTVIVVPPLTKMNEDED